jgi:phenylacetate-CoA ligase
MNLYQDVFFRGLDVLRGRRTVERLHFLRRSQHWDRPTLQHWQLARLNDLLAQARAHSDFYREALRDVRLPLTSLDQLQTLPILTKAHIRSGLETLQCRNLPRSRFVLSRTGGSTAEPTFYYWDKHGQDWNRASVYRSAEWAGAALGERTVQMSGSHFDYGQSQRLFNRIVYLLQRYRDLPVAVITDDLLEQYFQFIRRWRPSSLWGYASGLATFAEYIERRHPGERFDFLRALVTSSESLRAEQRVTIERVFGNGKVFDHYGSREMYLASECRAHQGYHIHADVLIVEVVDHDNRSCLPGERGRLVITDLSNHAFPFIRYEIGDVGVMADDRPCACGVTLPRLSSVEGRIADLIVLRDRILTPPNFATLMSDFPGIQAYQVRQDAIDELKVLIVPGQGYRDTVTDYIRGAVEQMVGGMARVDIEHVSEIPVSESGKRRYIVSSVSQSRL